MQQYTIPPELKQAIELIKQYGGVVHLPRQSVEVWNQVFDSVMDVAKDPRCEVSYLTLLKRLKKGVHPEEAVLKENPERLIVCWGEKFSSVFSLAQDPRCRVTYCTLAKKLACGVVPEEAVLDTRKCPKTDITRLFNERNHE
jgi:hypothetical protein